MDCFCVVLDGKVEIVDLVEVRKEGENTVFIKDKFYEVVVVRVAEKGDYFGFYGTYYGVRE